ncbi:hypothetical protein [Herpetosiphon giganteus]|uniref:hypothetical protein n=1 Tax=Herpetosiphon giganteus TaxID=2029754 RepID=UPI001957D79E|nr:hypothetical protein [Herpetosiphon giganteus]MBM7843445.1 hypothetical protein [Herpetosiphon giganteus]
MPSKIDPNDWDANFSAKGPRQQGPLGVLLQTLLVLGIAGGLGYGVWLLNQSLDEQNAANNATATAVAPTMFARATQRALQATQAAIPTATPNLPLGRSLATTPLRFEPDERSNSKGNINPNDSLQYIESREVNGVLWWNVRLAERANTDLPAADIGTNGWVVGTTVTEPSAPPPVVSDATAVPAGPVDLPTAPIDPSSVILTRNSNTNMSVSHPQAWTEYAIGDDLAVFFSTASDGEQGILARKVIGKNNDAAGIKSSIEETLNLLAAPNTQREYVINASEGTVKFVRLVRGQEAKMQAFVTVKPGPGGSLGVIVGFVPESGYAANEALLQQMTRSAIVQ